MQRSFHNENVGENGLRPVVTLESNVKIEISENALESSTPHKITEY